MYIFYLRQDNEQSEGGSYTRECRMRPGHTSGSNQPTERIRAKMSSEHPQARVWLKWENSGATEMK